MCEDPIVLEPAGFDVAAAWESCREDRENVIDAHGEVNWGAAFGADPGCVSCPACREMHWAWGTRQRCTRCAFEYPTSWWSSVGKGSGDRGTLEYATVPPSRPDDPYYMHGWRNPGLPYRDRDDVDWPGVVSDFEPWAPSPAESAAMAVAVRGDCKHYRGAVDDVCQAGVRLRSLVGGEDRGWVTRLPCLDSFRNGPRGGPTSPCPKFDPPTPEELAEEEAERDAVIARVMLAFPLARDIKAAHKKTSASGIAECPACRGKLHWSHAGCNGHVHMRCETEDCIAFME